MADLTFFFFFACRGFIDDKGRVDKPLADLAAQFPVHPGWYRAIREAERLGCSKQIVSVAAVLSTQASIFSRPKAIRVAPDEVHKRFWDSYSDHMTYLNAYYAYQEAEREGQDMGRWCYNNFINHKATKEAIELEKQLVGTCKRLRIRLTIADFNKIDDCANFRKAIALGFSFQTAIVVDPDNDVYMTPHGSWEAVLAPSSKLVGAGHEWIVFNKFHNSPLWCFDTVTTIELEWFLVRICSNISDRVLSANYPPGFALLPTPKYPKTRTQKHGQGSRVDAACTGSSGEQRSNLDRNWCAAVGATK